MNTGPETPGPRTILKEIMGMNSMQRTTTHRLAHGFWQGLVVLVLLFAGAVQAADGQKLVVSVKPNLYTESGYEAACVAVSLASLLTANGAQVTIFTTLDGVEMANVNTLTYVDLYAEFVGKWACTTSSGQRTLTELVNGFVGAGGTILVCPLCWTARFGTEAGAELITGAAMGSPASLAAAFLEAEKVIDF
jgi:sulfur relay (sulfurtransferase) complex TusBCD TusD component (DsrE family)